MQIALVWKVKVDGKLLGNSMYPVKSSSIIFRGKVPGHQPQMGSEEEWIPSSCQARSRSWPSGCGLCWVLLWVMPACGSEEAEVREKRKHCDSVSLLRHEGVSCIHLLNNQSRQKIKYYEAQCMKIYINYFAKKIHKLHQ